MKKTLIWLLIVSILSPLIYVSAADNTNTTVIMYTGIDKVAVDDVVSQISSTSDIRPFVRNAGTYIPFEFALTAFGGQYEETGEILTLTTPSHIKWYASVRRAAYWQDTAKVKHFDIISDNNTVYIELNTFSEFAGIDYEQKEGMIVMGKSGRVFDLNDAWMSQMQSQLFYERPDAERILADLLKTNPDNAHPRLLARSEDFDRIRKGVKTDPLMMSWYEPIKKAADSYLNKLPLRYELRDGIRLMYVTGEIKTMMYNLGLVYQVERDPKYARRACEELISAANFPDWHSDIFLDTAQALTAFAIGFDWCYDYFSLEEKRIIAEGLIRLGLTPARQMYDEVFVRTDPNWTWSLWDWKNLSNNWNPWCNCAIILASLAIGDEYEPEFCTGLIEDALRYLENSLPAYAPDGASEEGVGYGLGAIAYIIEGVASMMTALGTDYNYFFVPGIAEVINYQMYMNGPAGKFNYHDAGNEAEQYMPETFYYAVRLNNPSIAVQRQRDLRNRKISSDIKDILWYRPELFNGATAAELDSDKYFRKVETGSFRSSWDDPYAMYLAFHGGETNVSHMHYDAGTFVMDAMGERWACDLGSEPLTYVGNGEVFERYDLYRIKAEGHNTLYINPSTQEDQERNAWVPVEHYVSKSAGGYAIMDMTAAYKKYATKIRRGFGLLENRTKVVIQDEIEMKDTYEIYWGMHTRATIEVSDDKKTAFLEQNGKRMRASLVSDDGEFVALPAKPHPMSTVVRGQSADDDVSKLAVHITDKKKATVRVEFTCIYEESDLERKPGELVPLDMWTVTGSEEKLPTLKNVFVNGEPLAEFSPTCKNYYVYMPIDVETIPEITADGGDYNVEIIQPDDYTNSICRIDVYDDYGAKSVYHLYLMLKPQAGRPTGAVLHTPKGVTCSDWQSEPNEVHPAEDAIDGNLDTRWSAPGIGQWILLDLGEEKEIHYASISFANGGVRVADFKIEVSSNGVDWRPVYNGSSTGTTGDMETYRLEPSKGRYVRCIGYGNSVNDWNSIQEFELYAKE